MLQLPAPKTSSHQHIIPRHAKYVAISALILFALASSYIPAFGILYQRSNYRKHEINIPKRVEGIAVKKITIQQNKKVTIVSRSKIHTAITPTVTPATALNKKTQPVEVAAVKPTEAIVQAVLTSTPTVAPQPKIEGTASTNPDEAKGKFLSVLNAYRQKKGKSTLAWDGNLAGFAQGRAEKFDREGKMDEHAGFHDLINNDGFNRMGFLSLAENSSYGDTRDPIFIIETLYGQSPGHDANQLNGEYTHVGIGASGKATDFLFGGRKK